MNHIITTDMIIGTGLVIALLASIFCGNGTELPQNIASGLIGYLGRTALESNKNKKEEVDSK